MTTKTVRKRNLKRWGLMHALAMQALGYQKNDCERFYQVAYFIAQWVDLKGSLPKTVDFIACKTTIETLPHT